MLISVLVLEQLGYRFDTDADVRGEWDPTRASDVEAPKVDGSGKIPEADRGKIHVLARG